MMRENGWEWLTGSEMDFTGHTLPEKFDFTVSAGLPEI
jgi:hypothetical protein